MTLAVKMQDCFWSSVDKMTLIKRNRFNQKNIFVKNIPAWLRIFFPLLVISTGKVQKIRQVFFLRLKATFFPDLLKWNLKGNAKVAVFHSSTYPRTCTLCLFDEISYWLCLFVELPPQKNHNIFSAARLLAC